MAKRATVEEVRYITGSTIKDEAIEAIIDTANVLVNEILLSSGYSPALLKNIETWMAAHFLSIREPQAQTETAAGGASTTYFGKVGQDGLSQTRFGTQVLALDYKGILRNDSTRKAPDIEAL